MCTSRAQNARARLAASPSSVRVSNGTALAVTNDKMNSLARAARFEKFVTVTEFPITILALLIAPALVIEGHAKTPWLREAARAVNWIVWILFCGAYLAKLTLAPDRRRFVRNGWVDALIVVLSAPVPLTGIISGAPARVIGLMRFVR